MTLSDGEVYEEEVVFPNDFPAFTFIVNGDDDASFVGSLRESDTPVTLIKDGSGRLQFGPNSIFLTGGLNILGGTVSGIRSLVGDVTVNAGGALAPGSSIGTLNVDGNVHFMNDSAFEVELNAAGAADLLQATGVVTIDPGARLEIHAEVGTYSHAASTYDVISADGGVDGEFSTIIDNLPDLGFVALYSENGVQLTYVQDAGQSAFVSPKEIFGSTVAGVIQGDFMFAETVRQHGQRVLHNGPAPRVTGAMRCSPSWRPRRPDPRWIGWAPRSGRGGSAPRWRPSGC